MISSETSGSPRELSWSARISASFRLVLVAVLCGLNATCMVSAAPRGRGITWRARVDVSEMTPVDPGSRSSREDAVSGDARLHQVSLVRPNLFAPELLRHVSHLHPRRVASRTSTPATLSRVKAGVFAPDSCGEPASDAKCLRWRWAALHRAPGPGPRTTSCYRKPAEATDKGKGVGLWSASHSIVRTEDPHTACMFRKGLHRPSRTATRLLCIPCVLPGRSRCAVQNIRARIDAPQGGFLMQSNCSQAMPDSNRRSSLNTPASLPN